jgi:hypothetical protein
MTVTEFSEKVEEYILKDRQWKRDHRIGHAKMQLVKAMKEGSGQMHFWRAVLQRNEDQEA